MFLFRLHLVIGILCTLMNVNVQAQSLPEWLQHEVHSVNTLPPSNLPIPYSNESEAKSNDYTKSSRIKSLAGDWQFKWFKNTQSIPKDFFTNLPTNSWETITVPSYWQIEGLSKQKKYDKPYFNRTVPEQLLQDNALVKSDSNAVGVYYKQFTLPSTWEGKTLLLHFEGVKSACVVWLNGKRVGYSENSGNTFSFRIDPYLKKGANQLVVQVLKWSDGAYLENTDSWQVAGIYRNVYLSMHQEVSIEDITALATLDDQLKDGKLQLKAAVRNHKNAIVYNHQVTFALYDAHNKLIGNTIEKAVELVDSTSKSTVAESLTVPNVTKWNAEQPYLYTLVVQLKDSKGQVIESTAQKIGFRKITYKSNQLLINGKAVSIKGININTNSPTISTLEHWKRELRLMKQHNINAIWVNGGSPNRQFYELCDFYGFYVIDQVNIQTFGWLQSDIWEMAYTNRARALWEQNKNYPSIIGWSIGSNSKSDRHLTAVKNYLQLADNTRSILYREQTEDVITQHDIITAYALSASALHKLPKDLSKPTLLASISSTHGNGLGGINELWKSVLQSPSRQGGFIDNWSSNTIIYNAVNNERRYYRNYAPNHFPQGGVVSALGHPEPELTELKKTFESIIIATADTIDLQKRFAIITNKFDFQTLANYELQWNLFENGTSIQQGTHPLGGIKPNESKEFKLPIDWPAQPKPEGNYYLHLAVVAKSDLNFYEKGFAIASKQVPLRIAKLPQLTTLQQLQPLRMNFLRGIGIEITGSNFSITFEKETAQMSSFVYNDKEFLETGFAANFWRVPVVLDQIGEKVNIADIWRAHSLDSLKTVSSDLRVEKLHHYAYKVTTVKRVATKSGSIQVNSIYTIFSTGDVQVQYAFIPQGVLPPLPRFGLQMNLRENMDAITWFGRGPHENYGDRKASAFIGLYNGKISDQHYDYSTLQETGNKSEVQWFAIQDVEKDGLLFVGDSLLNFNVQNYTSADLVTAQTTRTELVRGLQNVLTLDMIHEGLTYNFQREKAETLKSMTTRRFSFRIKPINAQTDFFKEANQKLPILIRKSPVEVTTNGKE